MDTIQGISGYGEWEISRDEIRVMDVLGSGSFGEVRRARWRGTVVAVKTSSVSAEKDADEFKMDFLSLTKLHHPNIVQLLGACTEHTPYMICMEFVPFSLDRVIYTLTNEQKLEVSADIAKGLAYLHNRKPSHIIHRDIKPPNVLLTASMKAKLTDFGISMFRANDKSPYKMTGETGTYRYMAPEVVRSEEYNHKVDIWSFGMVMYHMFEGHPPYSELSMDDMIRSIGRKHVPCICNQITAGAIHACLKTEPSERIEALDLVDVVESIKFPTTIKKASFICCMPRP